MISFYTCWRFLIDEQVVYEEVSEKQNVNVVRTAVLILTHFEIQNPIDDDACKLLLLLLVAAVPSNTLYRSRKTFATFVFCFVLRDIFLPPPPTLSLSPALTILEREKLLLIHFFVYGFKRVPIHCSIFVHSF